jgi:hypothetical protein
MFVQRACFAAALALFVICAHSIKANDLPSGGHTASVGSWGFETVCQATEERQRRCGSDLRSCHETQYALRGEVVSGVSSAAEGVEVPLSNGMAVAVEIKTGSRRLIDYVLSPLAEMASGSMKER